MVVYSLNILSTNYEALVNKESDVYCVFLGEVHSRQIFSNAFEQKVFTVDQPILGTHVLQSVCIPSWFSFHFSAVSSSFLTFSLNIPYVQSGLHSNYQFPALTPNTPAPARASPPGG